MEGAGVKVIDSFVPCIEELYRLSDVYVFPVIEQDGAIEMPLSVIEAMACNLPVLTTRFGCLSMHFSEDPGFRYFETKEELIELVPIMAQISAANNKKVADFTWNRMTDSILSAFEKCV